VRRRAQAARRFDLSRTLERAGRWAWRPARLRQDLDATGDPSVTHRAFADFLTTIDSA
jgi:hypothetical protein